MDGWKWLGELTDMVCKLYRISLREELMVFYSFTIVSFMIILKLSDYEYR